MEKMGQRMPAMAGGVFIIEVSKHVHNRRGTRVRKEVAKPLGVLEGLAKPVAKPV